MLLLSRKIGERISIGDEIDIVVVNATKGRVELGVNAPREVPIRRSELERREALPATDELDRAGQE